MKNKTIYFISIVLLLISIMLVPCGCKKDKKEGPPNLVRWDSQGIIDTIGGVVIVMDILSPIYLAQVVIPWGALENPVEISIREGSTTSVPGHDSIKSILLLPKELVFLQEVEIRMPWSKINQTTSNTKAYYIENDSTIQQLEIIHIGSHDHLTTATSSHFGEFFSDSDESSNKIY